MKANEKIVNNLHRVSVSILIALNIGADHLQFILSLVDAEYIKYLLIFLINTVLYTFIFFVCEKFYTLYLNIKYPLCNISGKWYHYHYIEGDNDYLRFGVVNIKRSFFRVKMTGENYSIESFASNGPEPKRYEATFWHSIVGDLTKNGKILTCYSSEKTYGNSNIVEGIHHFTVSVDSIVKKKPQKIIGKFKDSGSDAKYGCIVMYRSEHDRNADLYKILKEQKAKIDNKNADDN